MLEFDNDIFETLDREDKIEYMYEWISTCITKAFLFDVEVNPATATPKEQVICAFYLGQKLQRHVDNLKADADEKRAEEVIKQMKSKLN